MLRFIQALSVTTLLCSSLCLTAAAEPPGKLSTDLENAATLVGELADAAPDWTWERVDCASILVVGKGGFIVGGTGGRGFLSCVDPSTGKFGPPVVLTVGGGSAGFQIGGQKAEVLMLFVGAGDVEDVVHTTPVFTAGASATAGKAGIGVAGGGNPAVESEVITVSRSEGLYAGAVGEGLVIHPDEEDTEALYGQGTDLEDLLVKHQASVPAPAQAFVDALNAHVKRTP